MPEDEGTFDSRPHFVIPYWSASGPTTPGDDGDTRPLPGNIVWYLCPGIHASPYIPGQRLDVTVDVRNYGGGNSPQQAQVTLWWAEPSTGFVVDPSRLIGFQMIAVPPRGGQATTTTMSKIMPTSAPPHICLLARVSHQYDRAGTVVDPVGDRHWAQRNLSVVAAQPGVPMQFFFLAGNPFLKETEFVVSARAASEQLFRALADEVRGQPVFVEAGLTIGERDGEEGEELRVRLRPGESRELLLTARLASEIGPEEFAAFELTQRADRREAPVGGVGVVIKGA